MMFNLNSLTGENTQPEKHELQDLRKKRDEYAVDIRKKKRDEILYKKRNKNLDIDQQLQGGNISTGAHNLVADQELKALIDQWLKKNYDVSELLQLVEAANSNDRAKQHYGVIGLRKILSNEQGPPIQAVIDANMVPRLIQFMQNEKEAHLQLEAAWALTNVASGTTPQTQSIIDKGGIPCFIKLLRANRIEVAEQAIWAIGNIAGDSATFRDLILKYSGLEPLLAIVNSTQNKGIIKHGTWAISNLCRGKPLPKLELVEKAIPTLSAVIQKESDPDVLTDAAWALSYLSRTNAKAAELVSTGIIPALVKHLDSNHLALVIPCLRTLGNIVTGPEDQTNLVLQVPDFLPKLYQLLFNKKKAVKREACWTISNITAGTADQIHCVMGNNVYVEKIIEIALSDIPEVQREAVWILSNATKSCRPEQVELMIHQGVMECMIRLLDVEDAKTVEVILEGLSNILDWGAVIANRTGSKDNAFLVELENKGAVAKIEKLQTHPQHEVYQKALKILENHFELENAL